MNRGQRLAALIAALAFASRAASADGPSLKSVSTIAGIDYSPDSVIKGTGKVTVRSDGYSGPFCVVFSRLSFAPEIPSPADGLSYGLYKTAESPIHALALDGPPAGADELLSGSFESGSPDTATVELGFAALVSPATLPPPGIYAVGIRASLYESAYPPRGDVVDSKDFSVIVNVGSHFDVSVVQEGSKFALASTSRSLDFGTLAANDSRRADILVRSNVIYSLSLSSAKGGALENSLDGSLLAYELRVNGELLSLPAGIGSCLGAGAPATYGAPALYRIVVTISPYDGLPTEGSYADALTMILAAP